MKRLTFDYTQASNFVKPHELELMAGQTEAAAKLLHSRKGPGNEFLGWLDLPAKYDKAEFKRIGQAAKRIQEQSEVLVVIGIGGSYLGAKAAIEMLGHTFYNNLPAAQRPGPEIYLQEQIFRALTSGIYSM